MSRFETEHPIQRPLANLRPLHQPRESWSSRRGRSPATKFSGQGTTASRYPQSMQRVPPTFAARGLLNPIDVHPGNTDCTAFTCPQLMSVPTSTSISAARSVQPRTTYPSTRTRLVRSWPKFTVPESLSASLQPSIRPTPRDVSMVVQPGNRRLEHQAVRVFEDAIDAVQRYCRELVLPFRALRSMPASRTIVSPPCTSRHLLLRMRSVSD